MRVKELLEKDPLTGYTVSELRELCDIKYVAATFEAVKGLERKGLVERIIYHGTTYVHWIGPGGRTVIVKESKQFINTDEQETSNRHKTKRRGKNEVH